MAAVRPTLKEPILVYSLSYAGLLIVVFAISHLGLPLIARPLAMILAALVGGLVLGWFIFVAAYVHFTQTYDIEAGRVLIKRGLLTRAEVTIAARNVSEVQAVMPFALRLVGVGLVRITTNDGFSHLLWNIKNPADFVGRISSPRANDG